MQFLITDPPSRKGSSYSTLLLEVHLPHDIRRQFPSTPRKLFVSISKQITQSLSSPSIILGLRT